LSFWDTSALLAIVLDQGGADDLSSLEASEGISGIWWGTKVEAMSALGRARRRREVRESDLAEM